MATFTIDLLRGEEYLFSGDFSGSGSTSGSTSWTELTNKPQWLSATTLNEFQTGHTHSQYLSSVTNLGTGITIGSKSGNTINLNTLKGSGNTTVQKIGNEIIIATVDEFETVSRTIYVDTTGSDITGDGSIGLPFKTILRALQDVKSNINQKITITIHLNAGSYSWNTEAMEQELARINKYNNGELIFTGDMVQVASGFTLTARNPEIYIYDVSSGTTFTVNEHQDRFLLNGGRYFPIAHNTATEIYGWEGQAAATSIYEPGVTINLTTKYFTIVSNIYEAGNQIYSFSNLKIVSPEYITTEFGARVEFTSCQFYMNTIQLNTVQVKWSFTNCMFVSTGSGMQAIAIKPFNVLKENVFRKTGATGDIGLSVGNGTNVGINGFYLYNYDIGLYVGTSTIYAPWGASEWILDSCTNAINIKNGTFISTGTRKSIQLFLNNVDYLIGQANSKAQLMGNYNCHFYDIVGIPNIDWLTADVAANGYINPAKGISILIPSIYPEYSDNLSETLADNSTGTTQIGDTTQNKSIFIKYSITRDTSKEEGTIWIDNKSDTNISIKSEFDDCGVSFEKEISGTEINLVWTTTSTGNAATFTYCIERIMV